MTVTISSDVLDAILHRARNSAEEVCGLLLGHGNRIDAALACANVAPDPARRFEIDPASLIAAYRAARDGGPALIGHYHSHPGGSPRPSACDAAMAIADGAIWLIVGSRDACAWRAVAHGMVEGRFDPVALDVSPCRTASCAAPVAPSQGPA